ncbi:MAG: transcription antitermination factor NusB [Pseudomonadota bacterium]|nr:transcription antitermination factor NusB [Pseudomonadota bacterium]
MIATAEPTGADIAAAAAGPRGRARLAAVQALYQNDMTGASIVDVLDEFIHHRLPADSDDPTIAGADEVFFARLARGAVAQREVTDAAITAALSAGWSLSRLGRIVLAILRVGGYEILAVKGVPRAVSINEYVDIAHAFFADKEPAFVNGVLDRLARDAAGADEPGPQSDGVG